MLTKDEIRQFMDEDSASLLKQRAKTGEKYYNVEHDIKNYRAFYYDSDGELVEDTTRSNAKIPHPFFRELVDQATQYILSGEDGFIFTDDTELQAELNKYFLHNDKFIKELRTAITDCQTKGFGYLYAKMGAKGRTEFIHADSMKVIEIDGRFTSDGQDHILYSYVDRVDKEGHELLKIMDWDSTQTYYYVQESGGEIVTDQTVDQNPRPHILYTLAGDKNKKLYYDDYGFIPFFRLDNNEKRLSSLKPIKELIDDYDLMASSLSNNLIDFDHPLYVVKGFEGDDLGRLQQNLKTKKMIGVSPDGGVDVKTVDIPYEARKAKLELDEKNIYRFGMGLNLSGLKDTSATTNIAIKAAYSLLDLRCDALEGNIKEFMRKIVDMVVDEINKQNGTAYKSESVRFKFTHEIMSNEQENATIEKTNAEKQQIVITTLLSLNNIIDDETVIKNICDVLDIDYEDIKDKLPKEDPDETDSLIHDLGGGDTE